MDAPMICSPTLTSTPQDEISLPSVIVSVTPEDGSPIEATLGLVPLVVGTSPECDLVVSNVQVSRRHCELRLTPRGIILRDLGSKNGTFLGDVPIVEVILPLGVTVRIGGCRLSVRLGGDSSSVALSSLERFGDAVGRSIPMRALFAKLERAAPSAETILLLGGSGTGKEVLAHAIHAASPRKDKPFVVFDCSAISPSLIESELFGHVRGAFTGAVSAHAGLLEQANGGTLFIDEIGELPLDLQPKLLRALEARKVRRIGSNEWVSFDARVVAATHRNLKSLIAEGAFREDLYFRLAVVQVHVPSLRERKDDIPLLVERFLSRLDPPLAVADLPPFTMACLEAHDWPGNVRELRNMVSRLILFRDLGQEALDLLVAPKQQAAVPKAKERAAATEAKEAPDAGLGMLLKLPLLEATDAVVEQFKRRYIAVKLEEHGRNVSRTADAIGVSRQHLHRLIERLGLRDSERQQGA